MVFQPRLRHNFFNVNYLALLSELVDSVEHFPFQHSYIRKGSFIQLSETRTWINIQLNKKESKNKKKYHFRQISGAFRSVPSPLQGTSQRTRSNKSWSIACSFTSPVSDLVALFFFKRQLGKCWASWFVTIKLAVHILFVWWMRRLHLWTSTSLAITFKMEFVGEYII